MRLDKPSIITCFTAARRTGVGMSLLLSITGCSGEICRGNLDHSFSFTIGTMIARSHDLEHVMIRRAADRFYLVSVTRS